MVVAEPLLLSELQNGMADAVTGASATDMAGVFLAALLLPEEREGRRLTPG